MQPVKFSLTGASSGNKKIGKNVAGGLLVKKARTSVIVGKTSALLGNDESVNVQMEKREIITHIEGRSIVTEQSLAKAGPLIIPVIEEEQGTEGIAVDGESTAAVVTAEETAGTVVENATAQSYSTKAFGLQIMAKKSTASSRSQPLLMRRNRLATDDNRKSSMMSEEERLQHDLQHRPNAASAEAYDRVPIEEFGAALLRGMGWKDGEAVGRNKSGLLKPVELKRRPDRLGLGAKPPEFIAPLPPAKKKRT
jgi:hypothetical protein